MNKKQELIDYVIGNEFITKPSLQDKFTTLLDEAITEQLILHGVSQRSELLNSFATDWDKEGWHAEQILDRDVDRYMNKTI